MQCLNNNLCPNSKARPSKRAGEKHIELQTFVLEPSSTALETVAIFFSKQSDCMDGLVAIQALFSEMQMLWPETRNE